MRRYQKARAAQRKLKASRQRQRTKRQRTRQRERSIRQAKRQAARKERVSARQAGRTARVRAKSRGGKYSPESQGAIWGGAASITESISQGVQSFSPAGSITSGIEAAFDGFGGAQEQEELFGAFGGGGAASNGGFGDMSYFEEDIDIEKPWYMQPLVWLAGAGGLFLFMRKK